MGAARIAKVVAMALVLAACASTEGPTPPAPLPQLDMAGRWMLSAPRAPPCGMEFEGAPGQQQGNIKPEGGCPSNFYMSRHWVFAQDTLTIADQNNQALAEFKVVEGRFAGKSTAGLPVTLSR